MKERAKQTGHDGTNVAVASPRAMAVADDGTLFVAGCGRRGDPSLGGRSSPLCLVHGHSASLC